MGRIIDFLLWCLKWPAAVYLLFSLPALFSSYDYFEFNAMHFYMFALGAGFYLFTIVAVGYNNCHSLQVISHELTHVLFAYLTLHNAGIVRINPDGDGGSMRFWGRGNWLIALAPYFFPLLSFLYMLLMPYLLAATGNNWIIYAIFGYFFAYYVITVLEQVHPRQTDIIREGYVFSSIIIIGANLYITGMILAFNSKQWDGVGIYLGLVNRLNGENLQKAAEFLANYI